MQSLGFLCSIITAIGNSVIKQNSYGIAPTNLESDILKENYTQPIAKGRGGEKERG